MARPKAPADPELPPGAVPPGTSFVSAVAAARRKRLGEAVTALATNSPHLASKKSLTAPR